MLVGRAGILALILQLQVSLIYCLSEKSIFIVFKIDKALLYNPSHVDYAGHYVHEQDARKVYIFLICFLGPMQYFVHCQLFDNFF